jgi:hypothetical protein
MEHIELQTNLMVRCNAGFGVSVSLREHAEQGQEKENKASRANG